MKFGSSTLSSLGCHLFSCRQYHHDHQYYRYFHIGLMMLLIVSNIVHVSSKMSMNKDTHNSKSNSNSNNNSNYNKNYHQHSIELQAEAIKMNILVISNATTIATTEDTKIAAVTATPLTLRTRARTRVKAKVAKTIKTKEKGQFAMWNVIKTYNDDNNNDVNVKQSPLLLAATSASSISTPTLIKSITPPTRSITTRTRTTVSSILHGKHAISAITQLPLTTINNTTTSSSTPIIIEAESKTAAAAAATVARTSTYKFSLRNHTAHILFKENSSIINIHDITNDKIQLSMVNVTNKLINKMPTIHYNNNNSINHINKCFHSYNRSHSPQCKRKHKHKRIYKRDNNCSSSNSSNKNNHNINNVNNNSNNNEMDIITAITYGNNCICDSSSCLNVNANVNCINQRVNDINIAIKQRQYQSQQQHQQQQKQYNNNYDNYDTNDNDSIKSNDHDDDNNLWQINDFKLMNGYNHSKSNLPMEEINSIKTKKQQKKKNHMLYRLSLSTLISSQIYSTSPPSSLSNVSASITLNHLRDQLQQSQIKQQKPQKQNTMDYANNNNAMILSNAAPTQTTIAYLKNLTITNVNKMELHVKNLKVDDEPAIPYNEFINITRLTTTSSTTTTMHQLQQQQPQQQQQQQQQRPYRYHEKRHKRQTVLNDEQQLIDKCRMFVEGDTDKYELYSPDYPNNYPPNINCTRVLIAPKGQIIRLDFRNSFHIEDKEECKFDFLEIRDGQYGFSNLIGKYCGTDFPPEITSRERYLWLHFHSDESIEYSGFTAVYEFIDRNRDAPSTDLNCTIEKDGFEGFVNSTDVPHDIRETVIHNKIPLDCMWRIQVQDKWKIQVKFLDFKLSKPNDCETNFLDIFPEQTVMPLRVKNFCGSAGEGVTSDSNILHMRFYAEQIAINSSFAILYTAFRDRASNANCIEGEYDCEDATCIAADLRCNGRDNCKFRWDEEGCKSESEGQKEHMIIIITVFGLILGGMVLTFLVNCIRKILRDQKIIREHIRQSKESKLDELSRRSKTRSRDNLSPMSPRQKHSQTSLQILDDVSNRYYREVEAMTIQQQQQQQHQHQHQLQQQLTKEKDHSILHHRQHPRQHDMIVQTSLCSTTNTATDSSTTNTTTNTTEPTQPHKMPLSSTPSPPVPIISSTLKLKSKQQQQLQQEQQKQHQQHQSTGCDMGCQTRESLFSTVSLWRHKSKTSTSSSGGGANTTGRKDKNIIEGVPPPPMPRFSTFGYDSRTVTPSSTASIVKTPTTTIRGKVHRVQESIEMEPLNGSSKQMHSHPHPHQHQHSHHHHQHLPQYQLCQYHQQQHRQQQLQLQQQQQQQQQHQHMTTAITDVNPFDVATPSLTSAHATSSTSIITTVNLGQQQSGGVGSDDYNSNVASTDTSSKNKQHKMDESKIFIDIRNSAPDVIIMTSH